MKNAKKTMLNPQFVLEMKGLNLRLVQAIRRKYKAKINLSPNGLGFSFPHPSKNARVFLRIEGEVDKDLDKINWFYKVTESANIEMWLTIFPDSAPKDYIKKLQKFNYLVGSLLRVQPKAKEEKKFILNPFNHDRSTLPASSPKCVFFHALANPKS